MESVTREQLRELFSQAGEVTKVDIPDGGRSMVRCVAVVRALPRLLAGCVRWPVCWHARWQLSRHTLSHGHTVTRSHCCTSHITHERTHLSQGYGFITFSNPQAAEQAMLLFNNYPLVRLCFVCEGSACAGVLHTRCCAW
jgi:RNA recognition motif-containing protein